MSRILSLLCAAIFLTAFQCSEDSGCIPNQIQSSFSLELKPESIEYDILDTIWLSKELGPDLELTASEETISLVNGALTSELFIVELNGDLDVGNGFDDFEIIPVIGTLAVIYEEEEGNAIGNLEFLCDALSCKVEVGLVAKTKGSYSIGIAIGYAYRSTPLVCEPKYQLSNNYFEVDELNKSVYEDLGYTSQIRIPWGNRTRPWGLDSDDVYSFKVR